MGELDFSQKVSIQQGKFEKGHDTIVDLVWRDAEAVADCLMDKTPTKHYSRWHSEVIKELKYYRKYLQSVTGCQGQHEKSGTMFIQTTTLARRYVPLAKLVEKTDYCVRVAHFGVIKQNSEDEEERRERKERKKKSKNENKRKGEFSSYYEDPEPVKRQKTVVSVDIPRVSPSIKAQFEWMAPEDDDDGDNDFGNDRAPNGST